MEKNEKIGEKMKKCANCFYYQCKRLPINGEEYVETSGYCRKKAEKTWAFDSCGFWK